MPLAPQLFSHLGLVSKDRSEKTALLGTTPGPFPKSYTKEFALFHTWVYSCLTMPHELVQQKVKHRGLNLTGKTDAILAPLRSER